MQLYPNNTFEGGRYFCSNPDIQKYIPDGVKYLKRSESLDQDTTKMNEVLQSFAEDVQADIYVMTHTTAPFISVESIIKGLKAVQGGEYDSSFAAKKLQDFLWKDGMPFNYKLDSIPRTQDLPVLYEETSGFYIYRNNIITKFKRRIGEKGCEIGGGKGGGRPKHASKRKK